VSPGAAFAKLARSVRGELNHRNRYAHSLRVARLAASLARAHGEDPWRALIAGMLHDLARLYSRERLLDECAERNMPIDEFERAHPLVLHSRLGAELARERYGVRDEDVLSAIRLHTLAAPEMTVLDKIVYLADSLEPERAFEERAAFLNVARENIDEALRLVLLSSVAHLRAKGLEAAPQTIAAVERYAAQELGPQTGKDAPMEDPLCPI
jgi:predicted HD superfamily hydrolase involved in NAD metabolism